MNAAYCGPSCQSCVEFGGVMTYMLCVGNLFSGCKMHLYPQPPYSKHKRLLVLPDYHTTESSGQILRWKWTFIHQLINFIPYVDIYVSCVSFAHNVSSKGHYLAMVSTTVETANPEEELKPGLNLLGPILKKYATLIQLSRLLVYHTQHNMTHLVL